MRNEVLAFCLVGVLTVLAVPIKAAPLESSIFKDCSRDLRGCPRCPVRYFAAKAFHTAAISNVSRKQLANANRLLEKAIKELGEDYLELAPGLIDETGLPLVDAEVEEERGHLARAADLRMQVLDSRFALFRNIHGCHD